MDDRRLASMADELQKIAGIGSFLTGGIKTLGRLAGKGAQKVSLRGLHRHGSMAYRKAGGGLAGAKAYLGSPVGQAATTAGIGGLAGYGGYKATIGRDSGPRQ